MSLMQAQALKGRMKYTGRPVDECDRHELRTWVIHLHIVGPSQDTLEGSAGQDRVNKGTCTHTEGNWQLSYPRKAQAAALGMC